MQMMYMRADCHIRRAEGFSAHSRIRAEKKDAWIIATLNTVSANMLALGEASLEGILTLSRIQLEWSGAA